MTTSTPPRGRTISVRFVIFLFWTFLSTEFAVALIESDELTLQDQSSNEGRPFGLSSDEFVVEDSNFGGAGARNAWEGSSQRGEKKISFSLDHDLGFGFKPAGQATVRMRASISGGQKFSKSGSLSRTTFSKEDEAAFQRLVERNGYYKIRAPSNVLKESSEFVIASISASCLAAASFQEALEFHMDQRGYLIGLSIKPKEGRCSTNAPKTLPTTFDFKSSVTVHHAKVAPKILQVDLTGGKTPPDPKMKGVNSMSADPSATGENAEAQPKTFWQKYWLYIMGGVMLLLNILTTLSAMPDDQPGPAGAARAGGGGARRR